MGVAMRTKYLAVVPLIAFAGGCATIPSDMVGYFNSSACPKGWAEVSEAWRGRYVVISTEGSGQTVGEALSPGENRVTGDHGHAGRLIDRQGRREDASADDDNGWSYADATVGAATPRKSGETVRPGTNAPYVMLRACTKR